MFKILEKWKILNLRVKYEIHNQNKVPLSFSADLCILFSTLIDICWRPLKHVCKMKHTGYDKYDCMVATPTSLSKTVIAIFNGRCHHWQPSL